jgi:hypothetical protein
MSETELKQNIEIDTNLKSYAQFYDHDKARDFDALVSGTKLSIAGFALCTSWKAASNAMRLPWLTVASIENFGRGFAKERSFAPKFTKALAQQLPGRMAELKPIQRLTMEAAIHDIGEKVQITEKVAEKAVDKQEVWGNFIDPSTPGVAEFRLAVWGSQRIGYSAIYHAYENFVRECMVLLESDPDYRISNIKRLVADVQKHFGKTILDDCIADSRVDTARKVRNALAHNGGMVTAELPSDHGISVVDGMLQIRACDTRQLMELLQDRVHRLAAKGITLPQLR